MTVHDPRQVIAASLTTYARRPGREGPSVAAELVLADLRKAGFMLVQGPPPPLSAVERTTRLIEALHV